MKNTLLRSFLISSFFFFVSNSANAQSFLLSNSKNGDYVVVFHHPDGGINCWRLESVDLTLGPGYVSFEAEDDHMIYLYGSVGIVQVDNKDFETAAKNLDIKHEICWRGKYPDTKELKESKEGGKPN